MDFDFVKVEASRAAARRERSEYVHCLLIRTRNWLLELLKSPGNNALQAKPCC